MIYEITFQRSFLLRLNPIKSDLEKRLHKSLGRSFDLVMTKYNKVTKICLRQILNGLRISNAFSRLMK